MKKLYRVITQGAWFGRVGHIIGTCGDPFDWWVEFDGGDIQPFADCELEDVDEPNV